MSISPVPIRHMAPLSNITPFTYSDGWTYLQVLTRLREYLQDVLTPEFAKAIEDTYNEFQAAMDAYHAGMTLNIEQFNQLFNDYVANVETRFAELAGPAAQKAVDDYLAQPETIDRAVSEKIAELGSATRTAADTLIWDRMAHVTVGESGQYATINDVFMDHPTGNVRIELLAGEHHTSTLPSDATIKNVTIQGQGRQATMVHCDGPFIKSVLNQDQWILSDFYLSNTRPENTDTGIEVIYPRRWIIERLYITGYGHDSISYLGGLNSRVTDNYIIARDRANVNGHAGVYMGDAPYGSNEPSTTIISSGNYVGAGKEYGFLFYRTTIGSLTIGDIAEGCAVGFRFDRASMVALSPYTEANDVGIEFHDSQTHIYGSIRDEPVTTWSGIGFLERRNVRVSSRWIDPGIGLLFRGASGASNFEESPSLRWDTSAPNGRLTGPNGSLAIHHTGGEGGILYVKEGAGNTGWVPVGPVTASTEQLNSALHAVNSAGKRRGVQYFNRTTNRPVWATGNAPADAWVFADGTVAHSPA